MYHRRIVLSCTLALLCACSNAATKTAIPGVPAATAESVAGTLYAYSPDETPLLATYPSIAKGPTTPLTILAGSNTRFTVPDSSNLYGGGISIAPDGTQYVFDGMRAHVLTFAPGSHGNVAPVAVELLPKNDGVALHVPQYAGFALDTAGNFWTADRSNGTMRKFRLGGHGVVKALTTFKPSVAAPKHTFIPGVASTVASDGLGNVYCVCQPDDLALQDYCITEYDVTGRTPKLVRSYCGILGDLDTQIPASVLYVDAHTKTVYVGIYTPAAVVEYPADAPSGPAPAPHVIGGPLTTLDSVPAAITTDSQGRVYVAQRDAIAVFTAGATGNVKPVRIISDPKHLHFLDYAYGALLAIH